LRSDTACRLKVRKPAQPHQPIRTPRKP
jgi:hypothetical protein